MVALGAGQYGTLRRAPALRRMKQERDEARQNAQRYAADHRQLVDAYLFRLSRPMGYGTDHRITLYGHEQDRFVCAGRHSAHSTHHEASGETVLPADHGHLRRAWDEGEAIGEHLPHPATEHDRWVDALRHAFRLDDDGVRRMSMPSRSIAAFAVRDEASGERWGLSSLRA